MGWIWAAVWVKAFWTSSLVETGLKALMSWPSRPATHSEST